MNESFAITLHPRYRDLDPNGHVNHAVYATYMEEARAGYWRTVIGGSIAEAGVAIVSLSIEYAAELSLDQAVTVGMTVTGLGDSSIPQAYELRTDGQVIATGEAVLVAFDREGRAARSLPTSWRDAIREHEAANGSSWATA